MKEGLKPERLFVRGKTPKHLAGLVALWLDQGNCHGLIAADFVSDAAPAGHLAQSRMEADDAVRRGAVPLDSNVVGLDGLNGSGRERVRGLFALSFAGLGRSVVAVELGRLQHVFNRRLARMIAK